VLIIDHTYDQVLQAFATKMMKVIIANQGNIKVIKEDVSQWRKSRS